MFYIMCVTLAFIAGIGGGITLCISAVGGAIIKRWKNGIKCIYPVGDGVLIITEIQEVDPDDNVVLAIVERK